MLMSAMDAFMTLQLLDRGAIEINPIMAAVIGKSALTFAVTKMLLTGFCVLALVYLAKARFFEPRTDRLGSHHLFRPLFNSHML